jgi:hypothetical protein
MKNLFFFSIILTLLLTSCYKRQDIKPYNGNIYSYDANVSSSDYNKIFVNCYLSLDGRVTCPNQVDEFINSGDAEHGCDVKTIDFCYKENVLMSPASYYAENHITYTYNWMDVTRWPARVNTLMNELNISDNDFNTIYDINKLRSYSDNASEETATLAEGKYFAFKNNRYTGIIKVESLGNYEVKIKAKYVKN